MKQLIFQKHFTVILLAIGLTTVSCQKDSDNFPIETSGIKSVLKSEDFYYDLAYRWAPIHYQDVDVTGAFNGDHALKGKADYITNVNFDGDWNALNNWDNAGSKLLQAYCYYSVVETSTHYFIIYAFYHPRDWTDNPLYIIVKADEHENDMEGLISVVKKNDSIYGTLQGIVTTFHTDMSSFIPNGSPLLKNKQNIEGSVNMQMNPADNLMHPKTAQECRGHGLKAQPYVNINGDGIIYFPSLTAAEPKNTNDRNGKYKLIDIFEPGGLWEQRNNNKLFYNYGAFDGGTHGRGANAPWNWGSSEGFNMATDPAKFVKTYFTNFGDFSDTYIKNKYSGIGY